MDANRRVQQQLQRERDAARRRADKGDKQVGAAWGHAATAATAATGPCGWWYKGGYPRCAAGPCGW
jgi:hypothetical protein